MSEPHPDNWLRPEEVRIHLTVTSSSFHSLHHSIFPSSFFVTKENNKNSPNSKNVSSSQPTSHPNLFQPSLKVSHSRNAAIPSPNQNQPPSGLVTAANQNYRRTQSSSSFITQLLRQHQTSRLRAMCNCSRSNSKSKSWQCKTTTPKSTSNPPKSTNSKTCQSTGASNRACESPQKPKSFPTISSRVKLRQVSPHSFAVST